MRHLLTTLAATGLVVGLGLEVAPAPAQAAPLPQLNSPNNQASPIEKAGYWYGYRRYGYYPYWRPYYRPYYYGYYRPYHYGYWSRPYYRRYW
jgi:hypothetical protein